MRRAIGFLSVVAALSLAGCDMDFTGLEQLDELGECFFGSCGGYGGPRGSGDLNVTLAPDSLRLKVGEVAEVRETRGRLAQWFSRDSTIARVAAGNARMSTTEVIALRSGETWVIGYRVPRLADSVRVVVE